jgi:predicted phosphodiesterase
MTPALPFDHLLYVQFKKLIHISKIAETVLSGDIAQLLADSPLNAILNSLQAVIPTAMNDDIINDFQTDLKSSIFTFFSNLQNFIQARKVPEHPVRPQIRFPEHRRSCHICHGFPIAHSILPPMPDDLPIHRGNFSVLIFGHSHECNLEITNDRISIHFIATNQTEILVLHNEFKYLAVFIRNDHIFEVWTTRMISYLIKLHKPPISAGFFISIG